MAAARDAGPVGAFATYAMGEVRLREDPAAAVEILELAVSQAEAGGTGQIAEVARIALVSALVRLGRHDEALRVFPDLLHQLRRRGGWPQLWTSLRILAELLAALGRPQDSALLLASASASPSAPPITGNDIPRYRELQRRITGQIGTGAHQRITDQAALIPRVSGPGPGARHARDDSTRMTATDSQTMPLRTDQPIGRQWKQSSDGRAADHNGYLRCVQTRAITQRQEKSPAATSRCVQTSMAYGARRRLHYGLPIGAHCARIGPGLTRVRLARGQLATQARACASSAAGKALISPGIR